MTKLETSDNGLNTYLKNCVHSWVAKELLLQQWTRKDIADAEVFGWIKKCGDIEGEEAYRINFHNL